MWDDEEEEGIDVVLAKSRFEAPGEFEEEIERMTPFDVNAEDDQGDHDLTGEPLSREDIMERLGVTENPNPKRGGVFKTMTAEQRSARAKKAGMAAKANRLARQADGSEPAKKRGRPSKNETATKAESLQAKAFERSINPPLVMKPGMVGQIGPDYGPALMVLEEELERLIQEIDALQTAKEYVESLKAKIKARLGGHV